MVKLTRSVRRVSGFVQVAKRLPNQVTYYGVTG